MVCQKEDLKSSYIRSRPQLMVHQKDDPSSFLPILLSLPRFSGRERPGLIHAGAALAAHGVAYGLFVGPEQSLGLPPCSSQHHQTSPGFSALKSLITFPFSTQSAEVQAYIFGDQTESLI